MQNSSGFLDVVDHAGLRFGTSRIHLRLRFLHLMELESFFGALTMERKASFAASEGKLFTGPIQLPGHVELLTGSVSKFGTQKNAAVMSKWGSCITCFAGIPKSGCVLPASQSKVGGVQMFRSPGSRCCGG